MLDRRGHRRRAGGNDASGRRPLPVGRRRPRRGRRRGGERLDRPGRGRCAAGGPGGGPGGGPEGGLGGGRTLAGCRILPRGAGGAASGDLPPGGTRGSERPHDRGDRARMGGPTGTAGSTASRCRPTLWDFAARAGALPFWCRQGRPGADQDEPRSACGRRRAAHCRRWRPGGAGSSRPPRIRRSKTHHPRFRIVCWSWEAGYWRPPPEAHGRTHGFGIALTVPAPYLGEGPSDRAASEVAARSRCRDPSPRVPDFARKGHRPVNNFGKNPPPGAVDHHSACCWSLCSTCSRAPATYPGRRRRCPTANSSRAGRKRPRQRRDD